MTFIQCALLRLLMAGILLPVALAAKSQSLGSARAAFADGRFLEAAELGEALNTSVGFALAAQSLAVYAHFEAGDAEWSEVIERAIQAGEKAVHADSLNPEAYCQYAHAIGRYAQGVGTLKAIRKGLAPKVRRALEAALEVAPDYPGAHLTFGGWHADVAAAGALARRIYGANRKAAISHYERALELVPDSKILLYEYGIRLADLYRDSGEERAREMLETALSRPAQDKYDEYIHREIVDALKSRGLEAKELSSQTSRVGHR